ncbi:hypothetical protein HELRODRAFT_91961, partial [Helobdella robusta]|uniref:Alpha-carbonic anhydrase domain-containing protein n=1 Tax=Helobdella robusta TaxID=6412 RepID=T1G8A9_HELRO
VFTTQWSQWWAYSGISGPEFWGNINPEWYICNRGKHQSPISIDPSQLLFDPNLKPFKIDKHKHITGHLINNGRFLTIAIDVSTIANYINISGGPLAYYYRASNILIYFSKEVDQHGSEHRITGMNFSAEIQILGYNSELYDNATYSMNASNGNVGIALLLSVTDTPNHNLSPIIDALDNVMFKGRPLNVTIRMPLGALIPPTMDYMTYEGSFTHPNCFETVTWIIPNKPLYIGKEQFKAFQKLYDGEPGNVRLPLYNNARPTTPLNNRPIRTNIRLKSEVRRRMRVG